MPDDPEGPEFFDVTFTPAERMSIHEKRWAMAQVRGKSLAGLPLSDRERTWLNWIDPGDDAGADTDLCLDPDERRAVTKAIADGLADAFGRGRVEYDDDDEG